MRKTILLMTLLAVLGFGQNLLVNGDFEQDLSVGWVQTSGGYGTPTVNRGTTHQPDPDYEAMVQWYDNSGWIELGQVVDVPGPTLDLSFWTSLHRTSETSCWPAACFDVRYYNSSSTLLGITRYYYSSVTAWTATPTLHPIVVSDSNWHQYDLNVAEEISANLPGVDPGAVTRVGVVLFDTTAGG